MTPNEKCDHRIGIARERLARGDIKFGAYSAILSAARTERDRAASSATKRAAVPPPSRPSTPPPSKPKPRASTVAYSLPPEPKATAEEREAAIAGAMAAMREGDAYLKLLARDDELAAFGEHWESVAAAVENRPVRKRLHSGPPQPSTTPMSDSEFSAMWSRVQGVLEGS